MVSETWSIHTKCCDAVLLLDCNIRSQSIADICNLKESVSSPFLGIMNHVITVLSSAFFSFN